MNELEHLRSLWAPKIKRTPELIVPRVTYDGREGNLCNDSWSFKVSYEFRDALDINYEERRKDKKPYMVWTQGPLLRFKDGDFLHSKDGGRAAKIRFATPMGWDSTNNEMYQGSVVYLRYSLTGNAFSELDEKSCTQMQFLQMLIYGECAKHRAIP